MKKIFFLLVAIAALAACSKSEIQYEQTGEITLAPVTSNATKSVAGYNGDTFDGIFPTAIDLYVFANAGEAGSTPAAHREPYFKNARFTYNSGKGTTGTQSNGTKNDIATAGAYAGVPTHYWPNVKTLVFAGYSDACGLSKTTPVMNFEDNVLTIPAYVQNNATTYTAEGANDLMWFTRTEAYSKQATEIVATMKHACSWITINVKGDVVTAKNGENPGWILNSLVVKNIAHKGNAECGADAASWGAHDNYADENYYNAQTGAEFVPTQGTTFTTSYAKYEDNANNFIVIPQTPTTLEVTYSYMSDVVNNITFSETKVIILDYDGADATNNAWESGKHYIYNLYITATEILIDPVVVDWTVGVNTEVTI